MRNIEHKKKPCLLWKTRPWRKRALFRPRRQFIIISRRLKHISNMKMFSLLFIYRGMVRVVSTPELIYGLHVLNVPHHPRSPCFFSHAVYRVPFIGPHPWFWAFFYVPSRSRRSLSIAEIQRELATSPAGMSRTFSNTKSEKRMLPKQKKNRTNEGRVVS